ncbi:hypothetical protein DPMN_018424 [Dreissena polymorpha]|uniref:Uncharacterized protein n=1 Tax=Dreissena polymorpha TaxID=45954 RepID=A0A9D4NJB5_DREPO|nr:hypothetical protein DPMN_018424 [Dreissena polymorpha]
MEVTFFAGYPSGTARPVSLPIHSTTQEVQHALHDLYPGHDHAQFCIYKLVGRTLLPLTGAIRDLYGFKGIVWLHLQVCSSQYIDVTEK